MSADLGVDLWIKRDDLTGFALGGNKGRKLEYLLGEAIEQGADVVVTCGALQSNFIRQLGAACAVAGIRCLAAVMALPYEDSPAIGTRLTERGGNVWIDELAGVDLRIMPDGTWETLYAAAEELALAEEVSGKQVYRVPIGGSSPRGAYGFVKAAEEIAEQADPFDWIVFASSSGSTHTGLQYGLKGTETKILGIACDPEPEIADDFAILAEHLDALLGTSKGLTAKDFQLDFRFVGDGYGTYGPSTIAAIKRLVRSEGVFLDPIYSGKAFEGLLALVAEGTVRGRVLFWHTGGIPALFAMS